MIDKIVFSEELKELIGFLNQFLTQ